MNLKRIFKIRPIIPPRPYASNSLSFSSNKSEATIIQELLIKRKSLEEIVNLTKQGKLKWKNISSFGKECPDRDIVMFNYSSAVYKEIFVCNIFVMLDTFF